MYEFVDRPVTSLDRGARFLVWTMRTWARSISRSHCPASAIAQAFSRWQAIAALQPFHRSMLILNRDSLRPVRFCALACNHVSEDEALVITLVGSLGTRGPTWLRDTVACMVDEDAVGDMLGALSDLHQALDRAGLVPQIEASQHDGHGDPRPL